MSRRDVQPDAAATDQRNAEPADAAPKRPQKQRSRLRRVLLTPLGMLGGAILVAIGGAVGAAIWSLARQQIATTPAVRPNVQTDPALWNAPQGNFGSYTYVVPRRPGEIGKPPTRYSWNWQPWVHELGGVNTTTNIQLTVQGGKASQVLIQGLRAKIVRRRPALAGTAITSPAGGGTPNARIVGIDLDQGRVDYYDPETEQSSAKPFALTVGKGEVAVIYVDASTRSSDVDWRLELALVADGNTEIRTIDDRGKPFRTTSDRDAAHYVWTGRWDVQR